MFQWTFASITATSHQTFDLSVHLVKYHSTQEVLREEKNLAQDLQPFSEVDPNGFSPPVSQNPVSVVVFPFDPPRTSK